MSSTETHFLTQIFNDKNFKKEDLEKVISQFKRIEFAKGDFLIKQGKIAYFYYFMESGYALSGIEKTIISIF